MKTICPHCNQEYPDTPDEYQGQNCECQNCHQDFVVEKVRFCQECGAANAAKAVQCRQCGSAFAASAPQIAVPPAGFLRPVSAPAAPSPVPAPAPSGALRITPLGQDGKFAVYGDYGTIWAAVRQAMLDCAVRIKEEDMARGKIAGNCRYGINWFGMSVSAVLYSNGDSVGLEFHASFSDALDTMGSCAKKVRQLSSRLMELGAAGGAFPPAGVSGRTAASAVAPPSYSQRSGESYAGQAKNSLLLGILGLLFCGVMGIPAVIFASKALAGMADSGNEEGRGFAIAGLILGFVEIIVLALVILMRLGL